MVYSMWILNYVADVVPDSFWSSMRAREVPWGEFVAYSRYFWQYEKKLQAEFIDDMANWCVERGDVLSLFAIAEHKTEWFHKRWTDRFRRTERLNCNSGLSGFYLPGALTDIYPKYVWE
jgi:hypothetical protein